LIHVIGAGSFAIEVAEFCLDAGLEVTALVDLHPEATSPNGPHGFERVALEPPRSPQARAVIGTGSDRRALVERLTDLGWPFATVVHPAAHVARSATVADGAVVAPGAVVGAGAEIGSNALVSRGVLIGHHTRIGDRVTLNPGANVGGNCVVADDVFVGIGATVSDHVSLGEGTVVAAGAVVLEDVAPGARVQGVPAKPFER
jgi:UDP-perosamine 4-acetyltransferase